MGDFVRIVARHRERLALELGVRHDAVDRAHLVGALRRVLLGEEEDLARELLADLAREVRRAVAGVERADIGVRLLEPAVLGAGDA